jgi:hypothetical protein
MGAYSCNGGNGMKRSFFVFLLSIASLQFSADWAEASNVLIVDDDGSSLLVTSSDDSIIMFEREMTISATNAFFSRKGVWAKDGDIRITTLNGQCLIFLGGERVGTIDLPTESVDDYIPFFRFSEHGRTLSIMLKSVNYESSDMLQNIYQARVTITRP